MKCDAERLAEISARVDAASPGPWESSEQEVYRGESGLLAVIAHSHPAARVKTYCVAIIRRLGKHGGHGFGREVGEANRTFIAHARADVPDLLADLQDARAEIAALKSERSTR